MFSNRVSMDFKKFRVPIVLFLLALFLNIYGIWWGLPNYYNWSTDDQTPTQPLLVMKNHFKVNSDYPIFHYVLLGVVYSPYLVHLYLSGGLVNPHQGFPYGFTDPLTSLTVLLFLSRIVTAIMGAFIVVFVYLSVKALYGGKAGLFSALCVSFSYVIILFSHLGNLDIPYTFWFSIALYSYVKLIKTYKTKYYIFLGIFAGLAASTKDQSIGLLVLLPIPLMYLHFKHHIKGLGWVRTVFNKKLFYCLFSFIAVYALATNIIFNFSGYMYRLNFYRFTAVSEAMARTAYFPNTLLGHLQLFQDTLHQLGYCVGIALFFLFLTGLIYCLYKFDDYTFAFLIPLVSYYIFAIARVHYLDERRTIPIIVVLSFFAGRFLSDLVKNVDVKKFVYPVLVLIFSYSFLYGFSADLTMVYDSRHSAEDWMVKNIDKNAKIEVYNHYQCLPRFHALGFQNVSMIFFDYNQTERPPVLLFEPIINPPGLESLKVRNPDFIVIPLCCSTELEHVLFPEKRLSEKEMSNINKSKEHYLSLLLSEKAGYKIIKVFDNKIPFAPETPFLNKRANLPVIILKKE